MTDILAEGRKLAQSYHAGNGDGFANEGRKNAYVCDGEGGHFNQPRKPGCGAFIITIDREPGVTPFGVQCGACGQIAHSKMYRVKAELEPTHEWYRPDSLQGIDRRYFDHLSRGGLILRAIPGKPDRWCNPPPSAEQADLMAARKAALDQTDELRKTAMADQIESRQVRRARERKGPEAPLEIIAHGRRYRRID